jgi:hypothetical protein
MPYQGTSVSLEEMLAILESHDRTEAAACVELERAIEDRKIVLLLPDGRNDEGETLYCRLSPLGVSAVLSMLRDFPNRMQIPLIRSLNTPVEMIKAVRAVRKTFETACGLLTAAPPAPIDGLSRADAVRACIEQGMIPASTASWSAFCERVRDLSDGWLDKKVGTLKRGFDEKTIKRDVTRIMN